MLHHRVDKIKLLNSEKLCRITNNWSQHLRVKI